MQKIQWTRVYEQEAGRLLGVAYRYVKDRRQAEDMVQNAFVIAIQKAETFKGKGAFEGWLRRIVVNESLMYLRAKNPTFLGLDDRIEAMPDETLQADETTVFQIIQQAEFSQDDLLETANLLPEHHRVVFYLYVVDGYSHKDIAQQLNISEGTSKSHLNRARKKLQDLLYQKALDMKKHRKKSLFIFAWFSALFAKASPIDTLYREAFANFALPVPPIPVGVELASSTVSIGLSTGVVAGIATAVGGGAIVVGTLAYQAKEDIQEFSPDIQTTMEYEVPEMPVWFEDSTDLQSPIIKPIHQKIIEETPEIIEEEPPLIIKKTTVIIDTIYED
ncbi:MAG: sigma-70 family RNA polymerase sigma factor [Bacteroidales bacterium]|nr:sigma-70 family RNA polymerase sigma factor [Bacteroidales bacterium]